MRNWHAAQEPRGFANETDVHRFGSAAERDAWVREHLDDNSGQANTRAITARLAHAYLHGRAYRDEHNQLCSVHETA